MASDKKKIIRTEIKKTENIEQDNVTEIGREAKKQVFISMIYETRNWSRPERI